MATKAWKRGLSCDFVRLTTQDDELEELAGVLLTTETTIDQVFNDVVEQGLDGDDITQSLAKLLREIKFRDLLRVKIASLRSKLKTGGGAL